MIKLMVTILLSSSIFQKKCLKNFSQSKMQKDIILLKLNCIKILIGNITNSKNNVISKHGKIFFSRWNSINEEWVYYVRSNYSGPYIKFLWIYWIFDSHIQCGLKSLQYRLLCLFTILSNTNVALSEKTISFINLGWSIFYVIIQITKFYSTIKICN